MAVFDALGAITVVGPNLEHVRTTSASPVNQTTNIAVMEWPNLVLVAGLNRRQSNAVWPLHFMHLGGATAQTLRSFGENGGVVTTESTERLLQGYPAPEQKLARLVAASGPDAIFSVTRFTEYVVTKWDTTGTPVWRLRLESPWFPRKDTWRLGSSNVPPDARMHAVWYDSQRYLWTYAHVAAPDWQQARRAFLVQNPQAPPPPGGGIATRSAPASSSIPQHSLYRTMIEVIDVQSRALVTRLHFSGFVLGTLPDGRFVSYRESGEGIPYVDIISATLRR
jgi:hypothetical protein